MKTSITLLFILFAVVNLIKFEERYPLESFVKIIKSNGVYDLLIDIKTYFSKDVTIETCHQIYPKNDCEKAVLNYMPPDRQNVVSVNDRYHRMLRYSILYNLLDSHQKKMKIKIDIEKIMNILQSKFPKKFSIK